MLINKKKQKVAPGEMEAITITAEMIKNLEGKTLSFSIEQKEGK